ncbi:MAG: hypothetical protein EOO05_10105 [Chitinophagaceae bacterium]|nr:MAG: hypothetical protein EOO05_10105 [Chitinophagaceae bacterium]
MYTKETIDVFLNEIGFKPNMTKAEVKQLPSLLSPNEKLLGVLEGNLKKIHNRDIGGYGLAILTDKRVLFYRKSIIGTVTSEEIPVSKISSVSFRKGVMFASLAVITSGNEALMEDCNKEQAKRFSEKIQGIISDLGAAPTVTAAAATAVNTAAANPMEQLEKLFDLKQKGILTEDEYSRQKAKLLALS